MSKIIDDVKKYQAGLLNAESKQFAEMGKRWLEMEQILEGQFMALALEVEQLRLKGKIPSASQVLKLERFKSLLGQAQSETDKYARYASDLIVDRRLEIAKESWQKAGEQVGVSFNRMPAKTFEVMSGMMSDGSTLREYLAGVYGEAVDGMALALGKAVTQGWNPVKTARAMRDGLALGYERALRVARTEQLRSMREATRMAYEQSGIVGYYKRVAAKSERTCIACLLEDGKKYPVSVAFAEHPQGRCSMVPCVDGEDDPTWETGEQWFLKQPEAVQMGILGPGVFEKWKGGVGLRDLVSYHEDGKWGVYWKPVGAGSVGYGKAGMVVSGAGGAVFVSGAGAGKDGSNLPVSSYAWGNTNLTPAEIEALRKEIAEAGFDDEKNIVVRNRFNGVVVNGEVIHAGDKIHTGYEHYLKHVFRNITWPTGTIYGKYVETLKKAVLKPNNAILSASRLTEKQFTVIGSTLINNEIQFIGVVYRISRKKWVSGHIIVNNLDEYLKNLENVTWLQHLH